MKLCSINFVILPGLFVLSRLTMGEAAGIQEFDGVIAGSNKFALDLYMQIKSHNNHNTITSPIGVQMALAMVAAGAKGSTLNQIIKAAALPKDLAGYHSLVNRKKGSELKMASSIFFHDYLDLRSTYTATMEIDFRTAIQKLPFKANPIGAVKTINKWAANETNGKIEHLLKKDEVAGASIILANAIYFKANWKTKFDWEDTLEDKFFTSKSTHVKVSMMSMTTSLRYCHCPEIKSKFIELPYQDDRFRMVIILPDDIEGLQDTEKRLHAMDIARAMQHLNETKVEIKIPKFKIESDLHLANDLKKLGLKKLFSEDADLTGMTYDNGVRVSSVKQKAFIEIDEVGTEAAAATAVIVEGSSLGQPYVEPPVPQFIADHPFLFMIMADRDTNYTSPYPLFVGNVRSFKN